MFSIARQQERATGRRIRDDPERRFGHLDPLNCARAGQGSSAFLKKRTKKLLLFWSLPLFGCGTARHILVLRAVHVSARRKKWRMFRVASLRRDY
jgi:hypothetical protein